MNLSFILFFDVNYKLQVLEKTKQLKLNSNKMKADTQNTGSCRLTIFKPPSYIYKLSKTQTKNNQKLQYDTYYNTEYSLRKYNRKIDLANQSQLLLYEWRKQQTCPIVNVVYLQLLNKTISSKSSENGFLEVNVYTQHIEKILADMINLTLSEAIYVLKQCLLAYQELFLKFSTVSVNKFYLGLNAQGKIKVWINDNLSLNSNQGRLNQSQHSIHEVLLVQAAIVNKIVHMISLLASTSCKHFFYGLDKELTVKRFSFNNCLQFINSFVTNTKNIDIPLNLSYMLPRKNSVGLDCSNVKILQNTRIKTFSNPRKQTYFSATNNSNNFKHFGSFVRLCPRQDTQNYNQNQPKTPKTNQNKFRFKRYSEQIPKQFISSLFPTKVCQKLKTQHNQNRNTKQCKISLRVILQNNRRSSVNSNDVLAARKSNISLQKQRPSICIFPSFVSKSVREDDDNIKQEDKRQCLINSREQKSQKSYSLQSSKSKDYHSLVNSNIRSSNLRKFGFFNKDQIMYRTQHPPKIIKHETQVSMDDIRKSQQSSSTLRARSVSVNYKFGRYQLPDKIIINNQIQLQQTKTIQTVKSDHRQSFDKSLNQVDKKSTNSISNQGTSKKRSFLTKTNYDSNTDDNDKNLSFCRMDFSSMSIENRITNKNFDGDLTNSRKQELKRSLMSFKFGFEQILQNPSCKQVQQQNETKSYNGSSLRNTQNITDQVMKNQKKNQQTASNNFSFGNNSNRLAQRKHLKDSIQENWQLIKEKNESVLVKNQWKKTINNLNQLQNLAVNESIIDATNEIARKDSYADVRLDKLQRLGKNMCFSIVNRTQQTTNTVVLKRSGIK